MIGKKYLKILHGTVVNGVQDRLTPFRNGPLEITGGGGDGSFGARMFFKARLSAEIFF